MLRLRICAREMPRRSERALFYHFVNSKSRTAHRSSRAKISRDAPGQWMSAKTSGRIFQTFNLESRCTTDLESRACNVVSGSRMKGERERKRESAVRNGSGLWSIVSLQYALQRVTERGRKRERGRERSCEEAREEINDSISFLFRRQFYSDFPALHRQIRPGSG